MAVRRQLGAAPIAARLLGLILSLGSQAVWAQSVTAQSVTAQSVTAQSVTAQSVTAQSVIAPAAPSSSASATSAPTLAAEPAPSLRQSLLPLVQPLWSELKPAQQAILAPLDGQWNSMPIDEKRAWVALAARFPKMSTSDQLRASARIRELAKLNHEQRRMVRQNYRLAKSLPQQERVAQSEQYQSMTDEQKRVLQISGSTSNTGAKHAGSRTALAKEAAQPLTAEPKPIATQGPIRANTGGALPVNSLQPK